jgi:RNA polymerase sigma-70 factor (ECF subfamily)
MNDEAIIIGLADKDEKVFHELVKSFQKNVFHTCLGFVHNNEDAQDISQDVFIEIYRSVNKFRGDSKISTWVYRIAVNKSLNFLRKQKQVKNISSIEQLHSDAKIQGEQGIIKEPATDEHHFEKKELARILIKAIDSLPKNQRIAFTLSKYDDMQYAEIAVVMDMSLPAVESLIHRAKLNLQKKLFRYREGKY